MLARSYRGLTSFILLCVWLCGSTPQAVSLDFPDRPIRVVVPFAASGTTDIVTRILFDVISKWIGQSVVVDNRPGAGGNIGVEQVTKSAPDGYTLVVADPTSSLPANVTLFPNLSFHPTRDLAPIALFGETG